MQSEQIRHVLQQALGNDLIVVPSESDIARHAHDYSNHMEPPGEVAALAYPRTSDDVSRLLRACHAAGIAVVPQGGLTSMVGGALPTSPSLVISMDRMREIEEIDPDASTITLQAGCVLETVQNAASDAGLFFPLDLGGRGSAQIGGLISTNAGGNRVLRYGMMRESVLGLEVVLADGTIVSSLNKMLKNNAGYDLRQMFVGAEGTLGIVTRAVLRLFPKPLTVCTGMVAVSGYQQALHLLRHVKSHFGGELTAFEAIWPDVYRLGTDALGRKSPFAEPHDLYILIETMGTDPDRDRDHFETILVNSLEESITEDVVIAQSERQRVELWAIRDCPGEFTQTFWPQRSYDVSMSIGTIGAFVPAVRQAVQARFPAAETAFWGHIADSNLHLSIHLDEIDASALDDTVFQIVESFAGSVSAEHGIGTEKRKYLSKCRSAAEIDVMRLIKKTMDPAGILNPGKII